MMSTLIIIIVAFSLVALAIPLLRYATIEDIIPLRILSMVVLVMGMIGGVVAFSFYMDERAIISDLKEQGYRVVFAHPSETEVIVGGKKYTCELSKPDDAWIIASPKDCNEEEPKKESGVQPEELLK